MFHIVNTKAVFGLDPEPVASTCDPRSLVARGLHCNLFPFTALIIRGNIPEFLRSSPNVLQASDINVRASFSFTSNLWSSFKTMEVVNYRICMDFNVTCSAVRHYSFAGTWRRLGGTVSSMSTVTGGCSKLVRNTGACQPKYAVSQLISRYL